jgi:hypothetical protein
MVLPQIEAGVLHAGRRVTTFPCLKCTDMLTTAAATILDTYRNGIIPLTFTA